MPEIRVSVGGRDYSVACQEGEEAFLRSAAAMLDAEAAVLGPQAAKIPESRMLLMAGLLLADKTAGADDQVRLMQTRLEERETELEELKAALEAARAAPLAKGAMGAGALTVLTDLADRVEALADEAEAKIAV